MLRDAFTAFRAYLPADDQIRTSDRFAERLATSDQVEAMFVIISPTETGTLTVGIEHSGDGVHWAPYGADLTFDFVPGTNVTSADLCPTPTDEYPYVLAPPLGFVRLVLSKDDAATDVMVEVTVALRDLDA